MLFLVGLVFIGTPVLAQGADEGDSTTSQDGEKSDGDTKDGDAKDGDAKDGDAKDGDAKDGDAKDGDAKDGDAKDGESKGEEEADKTKEEAEKKAKEEAARKAKEEAARKAKEEADKKAVEEAERRVIENTADPAKLSDDELKPLKEIDTSVLEKVTIRQTYPYVEHHGLFRFRADAFGNLDLDTTGTSPILPPPEAFPVAGDPTAIADTEADWYAGANIRFRYTPTLHLYEDLRIKLQLDVPDNLVLGSLPDGAKFDNNSPLRPDIPKLAFTGGQAPPSDALRIKQAYGEVTTFFGVLRAGRMASNWGLGMLANDGQCMDCDYGDTADRFMFITRLPVFDNQGLYVAASWDFSNEGPLDLDPLNRLGQSRDLSQLDDVNQYVLALFSAPLKAEEKAEQAAALRDRGEAVLNGGAYVVFRSQEASFEDFVIGEDYNVASDNLPVLEARKAEAIIPDLWVQFLWEPEYKKRLRLELETVLILGSMDFVAAPGEGATECFTDPNAAACQAKQRDIFQFGLAFEGEYRFSDFITAGLNSGFATGRNEFGFQVNDGVVDPEGTPSNFKFDRDYHVDLILFREIIGTVTNATYVNPWIQLDFWTRNQDSFGVRLDSIYSLAHKSGSTPSGERPLGLEFDGQLFYHEEGKFRADLSYGLLLPLAAFDETVGRPRLTYPGFDSPVILAEEQVGRDTAAQPAQTVQARMFWFF
jgi:uncharacterized protein (TIGR04551 family)